MRYRRWVPLTAETVKWIKDYHEGLAPFKSEWFFPGDSRRVKGGKKIRENHISKQGAYQSLKELFIKAGLLDTEDEIYSPHSMRKFAENYMIRCGLGDKFVGTIIGHAGPLGRAYKDEDDNETTETWFEQCSDKMTWLDEIIRIVEHDPAQEKRIIELEGKLAGTEDLVRQLLSAVQAKMLPHEGHTPTQRVIELQKLLEKRGVGIVERQQ